MKLFEKTLKEDYKFHGRIINLHVDDVELEDGSFSKREVVDHGGGVSVVLLNEKDEIFLVRQFRYPYKEVLSEIPAGKLEKGEDPFEAMKREQREETGTYSDNYVFLGELYPTPGYCGEIIRIWAARVSGYCEMDLDEDEFIEVEKIPLAKALEMVLAGEIKDSKTQVGIMKADILIKKGLL